MFSSSSNILITRSYERSKDLAKILEDSEFNLFFEPLFITNPIDCKIKEANFGAIIITSSNAVLAIENFRKDIIIYCVGNKTKEALVGAGFKNILVCDSQNALSLKDLIIESYKNKDLEIFYPHGSVITLDFFDELKEFDIKVRCQICYEIEEFTHFSKKLLAFSEKNVFDYVLIFSSNSAKIFARLVKENCLEEFFSQSKILCFSDKILEVLKKEDFKNLDKFTKIPQLQNYYQ